MPLHEKLTQAANLLGEVVDLMGEPGFREIASAKSLLDQVLAKWGKRRFNAVPTQATLEQFRFSEPAKADQPTLVSTKANRGCQQCPGGSNAGDMASYGRDAAPAFTSR